MEYLEEATFVNERMSLFLFDKSVEYLKLT